MPGIRWRTSPPSSGGRTGCSSSRWPARRSSRTSSARLERDRAALLTRLYVLPAHQGVGVGRTLLQVTLACFPQAPVARLEVESQNEPAIAFYERMGFFLQRQARFDGREDTPNTLLMAKRLFAE